MSLQPEAAPSWQDSTRPRDVVPGGAVVNRDHIVWLFLVPLDLDACVCTCVCGRRRACAVRGGLSRPEPRPSHPAEQQDGHGGGDGAAGGHARHPGLRGQPVREPVRAAAPHGVCAGGEYVAPPPEGSALGLCGSPLPPGSQAPPLWAGPAPSPGSCVWGSRQQLHCHLLSRPSGFVAPPVPRLASGYLKPAALQVGG